MRKMGVILVVIILVCGAAFVLFKKYSGLQKTSPLVSVTVAREESSSESDKEVPVNWGMVSSAFGFSLRYPDKEVGAVPVDEESLHQIVFFFSQKSISSDESTIEKLSSDIHNIGLEGEFTISVIEPGKNIFDFSAWIKEFLRKEDSSYGNKEKALSERDSEVIFAGQKGYSIVRQIEGSKEQNSPHYIRKNIFIYKDKRVYRISRLAAADDTMFPRSGLVGKEFLNHVNILSSEILQTFVFDESSKTSIAVPKVLPRKLTGEAASRREKLLAVLRQGPFFDEQKSYPNLSSWDRCSSNNSFEKSRRSYSQDLRPSQGIYVSASDGVVDEKDVVELHAYDENGGHTGPIPIIPVFGGNALTEERAKGVGWTNLGSLGYGLSIQENINGRIEIIGKKFSLASLAMSGEGNSCRIAEMFIPVTPYSVATIPMTKQGDFGPISYDIDGDGIEDLQLSLIHPLLPQKGVQFEAVFSDMRRNDE